MTFRGAVVGCEPGSAGPRGRARWRKESASTIFVRYSGKSKYRATAYMRLVLWEILVLPRHTFLLRSLAEILDEGRGKDETSIATLLLS